MRGRAMFTGRGLIEMKIYNFFVFLRFVQAEYTGFCAISGGSMSFQLIDPHFLLRESVPKNKGQ